MEFWSIEQESKFLSFLGDSKVIAKLWNIPSQKVQVITSHKCFNRLSKDGIMFNATKHNIGLPRYHWFARQNGVWWDSYKADLQPFNTNNFCQSWACAKYADTLQTINAIPGDYVGNNTKMASFLKQRIEDLQIEENSALRCLSIVQDPEFVDVWLFT